MPTIIADQRYVRAPPRARSRGPPACRSTRRRGPARRSAASRSPSRRTLRGLPQQRRRSSDRPVELRAVRQQPADVDRRPASLVRRHLPIASKFSSAKPSGSICAWQLAQTGFVRCCSMRSRTDARLRPRPSPRAPARRAAAAAAACRACSRAPTCPARPARSASGTR